MGRGTHRYSESVFIFESSNAGRILPDHKLHVFSAAQRYF